MTVTSGFFNSMNGDRKYDAEQMSEIFDGVIADGVYATIYNQFAVKANEGMTIQIDTGRAWFDHTWTKNDNVLLKTLDPPELLYDRIDAVVIDVDHTDMVRDGNIKIVKGTPSATPQNPTLANAEKHKQYPLAYISVRVGAESISQADITNMVGTSACPFVTGVVSVMNIDMLIRQWKAQWDRWYNTNTNQFAFDFNNWFSQLQVLLDGDVAANLAGEILELKNKFKILAREHAIYETLDDSDNNAIQDSWGNNIEGDIVYVVKER